MGREMAAARRQRRAVARFNEARPNWAGKFRDLTPLPEGGRVASMRPGPIGPGNQADPGREPVRAPGFNEARPNWAGKSQCGAVYAKLMGRLQ